MKKSLIIMSFAVLGMQLHAKSPADEFMLFNTMESSHTSDWFDHMKKIYNTKYDLLKEQDKDWTSYINKRLSDWQNNADCSPASKDKIFTDELRKAIKLHKKQNEQFKKLCKNLDDDAIKIQKRHEKELNEFIKKYMPSEMVSTPASPAQKGGAVPQGPMPQMDLSGLSREEQEMMNKISHISPEEQKQFMNEIMAELEKEVSKLPKEEQEKYMNEFWAEVEKEQKKQQLEEKNKPNMKEAMPKMSPAKSEMMGMGNKMTQQEQQQMREEMAKQPTEEK